MVDDAYEQLLTAVTSSNLNKVKLLLSDGFDVNVKLGRKSETFLHLALDVDIINELLLKGANVNATNLSGETPLLRAIIDGKGLLVVQALLSAKADLHCKYYGSSLLHFSCDFEITRELLLHGLNVNVRNLEGRTPLHYAVVSPDALERVKVLLKCGADVNAIDNQGETALYSIISAISANFIDSKLYRLRYNFENDFEIVKELLEYGADINLPLSEFDMYSSPLGVAFSYEYLPLIELLIRLTMLFRFEDDYKSIIDLDPYFDEIHFFNAVNYLDECAIEIIKLKSEIVSNKHSLYNFVSFKKSEEIKPLYCTGIMVKDDISKNYPIYQDIVFSRIKLCIEKGQLLEKFRGLKIYALKPGHGKVFLISDCINKIGEYLLQDDLINFMIAFSANNL